MASKLGKVIANFEVQLSTKLSVGGTTATLSSVLDKDGNTIPNGRYFFTIDPDNSRKEHFSCVITGTAVTQLKTLNRTTTAETSGALREHKVGAKVIITDFAVLAKIQQILDGTESLDASAPLYYDGDPVLSSSQQLATVKYVLDNVTGGTVTFDKQVISNQTAGEDLTINDIVYFKEADQKWYKADGDLVATFDQLQLGLAKATVLTDAGLSIAISGPVSGFTGLTSGSKYYLSNTAGEISPTPGTFSVFIGWALNTTTILFNPLNKTAPTQKEKDALVGSQGVPSSTNKYVTQDNTSTATTDQTQLTQNSFIEFGEADATTRKNKIAQSFIPLKSKIRGVNLYKSADTGTFTGTVTVSLQADSSGSPSGSALATKTITNLQWLGLPVGAFETLFTSEYGSLTIGSLYWIIIETSTSDSSNHPNIGTNTAGGYTNGSVKYKNTTDSWVAVATIDLYFSTMEGNANQVVVTDSTGKIPSKLLNINIPFPTQDVVFSDNPVSVTMDCKATSSIDSSVAFTAVKVDTGNIYIYRYSLDSNTLNYSLTHSVQLLVSGGTIKGIACTADYVYVYATIYTVYSIMRYNINDLTSPTLMSGTPVAAGGPAMFSNGTDLYISSGVSTFNRHTISGTAITSVETITYTSSSNLQDAIYYNGYVYLSSPSTGLTNIYKYPVAGGALLSTTSVGIYSHYENLGSYASFIICSPKVLGITWAYAVSSDGSPVKNKKQHFKGITLP